MNKAIPIFKPLCTASVWFPKYVPSLITSLNQKTMAASKLKNPNSKKELASLNACIVNTPVVVRVNSVKDVKTGQGEGETK